MSFLAPGSIHRRDWNILLTPKGGALVSPFAFNAFGPGGGSASLSADGRTFTFVGPSGSGFRAVYQRTTSNKSGKRYWEIQTSSNDNRGFSLGIVKQSIYSAGSYPQNPLTAGWCVNTNINYFGLNPGYIAGGSATSNSAYDWTTQRIGIAVDFDAGKIWFRKSETWISGNPAAGTGATINYGGFDQDIACSIYGRNSWTYVLTIYPDEADWLYTPPAGFTVLA